jgi:hypothetical protein
MRCGPDQAGAATIGRAGQPRLDAFERLEGAGIVPHCFALLSRPSLRAPGARFARILRGFHAQPCVPLIVNSLLLTMERTLGTARFFSASYAASWDGHAEQSGRKSTYGTKS